MTWIGWAVALMCSLGWIRAEIRLIRSRTLVRLLKDRQEAMLVAVHRARQWRDK